MECGEDRRFFFFDAVRPREGGQLLWGRTPREKKKANLPAPQRETTPRFGVLPPFPRSFAGHPTQSLLKLAIEQGLVEVRLHNLRDWAKGKHKSVDDRPFGGGPGMVMMCEPVYACVEAVQAQRS